MYIVHEDQDIEIAKDKERSLGVTENADNTSWRTFTAYKYLKEPFQHLSAKTVLTFLKYKSVVLTSFCYCIPCNT